MLGELTCRSLVVNNAGVGLIGPIECQSIEEMKAIMETNFFGVVRMIKEVLPDMKRRRSGHIVVISSIMGLQGKLLLLRTCGLVHTELLVTLCM